MIAFPTQIFMVCLLSLKESKTVLSWDPTNSGSAPAFDKTHEIIQVEYVGRGVLCHQCVLGLDAHFLCHPWLTDFQRKRDKSCMKSIFLAGTCISNAP